MRTFKIKLEIKARAVTLDGELTYTWVPHGGKSSPTHFINNLRAFCREQGIQIEVEEIEVESVSPPPATPQEEV